MVKDCRTIFQETPICCLSGIGFLVVFTAIHGEPAGRNLLSDPSFEVSARGKMSVPTGWALRPEKERDLTFEYDAERKTLGRWSLRLKGRKGHLICWPKTAFDDHFLFQMDFFIGKNAEAADLDKAVQVRIWYYGANQLDYGKDRKIEPIQPEGWYRMSMRFETRWGATHGALTIEPKIEEGVWLDNLHLRPVLKPKVVRQKPYPQEELIKKAKGLRDPAMAVRAMLDIAGHLNASNDRALIGECLERLVRLSAAAEEKPIASHCRFFLEALDCFENRGYTAWKLKTGLGRYETMRRATSLLEKVPKASPLHDKAQFYIGRIKFGVAREGGKREEIEKARDHLRPLLKKYPTNELTRMILGEKIPWGQHQREKALKAPNWAGRQYEGLNRVRDVVLWWIRNRQAPTGEMGGGWGDDCEMLRHWGDVYFLTGDCEIRDAAAKMANGIVREIAPNGYLEQIADVEHAAEPTSDTAVLAGFDYGNPIYIERAMATARLMRDVWTGINRHGQRLFRSCWFGASGVRTELPHAQDIPLNARALKPVLWLAWYNRNPDAIRLLRDLGDAWIENARRTDGGKPKGFLPSAVVFETGEIGGFSGKWWSDGFYYSRWPAYHDEAYMHLAGTAFITGDAKYLRPMQWTLEQMKRFRGVRADELRKKPEGSVEWAVSHARWMALATPAAAWREESGINEHDKDIWGMGNSWASWRIGGSRETSHLDYQLNKIDESVGVNFPLLTSEVISTDRVLVNGSSVLFSMATGGYSSRSWPSYHVTWNRTGGKHAALVKEMTSRQLLIQIYSFADEPLEVDAHFWRLAPGHYDWTMMPEVDEGSVEAAHGEFIYRERGQPLTLTVPPGQTHELRLKQTKPLPLRPLHLPDIALSSRDLVILDGRGGDAVVLATIHNIGSGDAGNVKVQLTDGEGNELARDSIQTMPAPQNLQPSRMTILWKLSLAVQTLLALNVSSDSQEICSTNNRVEIESPVPSRDDNLHRLFIMGDLVSSEMLPLYLRALKQYRTVSGGIVDDVALNILLAAIDNEIAEDLKEADRTRLRAWHDFFTGKLKDIPPVDTKTPVHVAELESVTTHELCRVVVDPKASGGKAITYSSNNAWIEVWINLPTGRYRVKVRGKGTAATSDAIFIQMDGKNRQRTYFPLDRYTWKDAAFNVSRAGMHRFRIIHAEPEVLLDRIEIFLR